MSEKFGDKEPYVIDIPPKDIHDPGKTSNDPEALNLGQENKPERSGDTAKVSTTESKPDLLPGSNLDKKAKTVTPEEQAKQKIKEEYPKEKEDEIIKKGIEQKLKDPGFVAACEGNIFHKILASPKLSENQRRSLIDHGDFSVKGFLQKISRRDVVGLFAGGMEIEDIKKIKINFFTGKVEIPGGNKKTSEELDKLVEDGLKDKVREIAKDEVENEWERRKKEKVDTESIKIQAQQAEAEEKKEVKIRKAEKLPVVDRMELVNKLRNTWKDAEKISKALKTGRKLKTKNGETNEIFDPKIENKKKELIEAGKALSDEIINIANQLTGRKLKAEAYKETSYIPNIETPNEEKQKEFREWITKVVEEIFKNQVEVIEKETGKKVRFKKELIKTSKTESKDTGFVLDGNEKKTQEVPEKKEDEQYEVVEGIEKICEEYKKDFEKGLAGYAIATKIHSGETFMGEKQDELDNVEPSKDYFEYGKMSDQMKKLVGFCARYRTPDYFCERTEASGSVFLTPIERHEVVAEGKTKQIVPVKLKDHGFEGERKNEEVYSLSIKYPSEKTKYKEKRSIETIIDFTMPKSLAEKVWNGIHNDWNNFYKFLEFAAPELLKVTSPKGRAESSKAPSLPKIIMYKENKSGDIKEKDLNNYTVAKTGSE